MENLAYWNERAVATRNECKADESAVNCEQVAFTRCMVAMLEGKLFNLKGKK
jgi:hypothetical protein